MNHTIRITRTLVAALVLWPVSLVGHADARFWQRVEARLITEVPGRLEADSVVLQNPVGSTRFPNGTIAVADGMAPAILFFDQEGMLTGAVGRAGQGPGEFSTPGWMGRCGDGEATVWDFSLMRFTTVDAAGRITGQSRLQDRFEVPRPPAVLACAETGDMAVLLRLGGDRIEGRDISVLTSPLYVVRAGGRATVIEAAAPVIEWLNRERTYRPVSMSTHFAISDLLVYVARSDSAVVRAYDLDGNLRSTFSLDLAARAPTDGHVRRDAERHTAFIADRAARARITEEFMRLPRPERLPYFNGIHLDPLGRLWVVRSFPGDAATLLAAFSLRGEMLGQVEIPEDLKILEVGEDYVLGSTMDPRTLEPGVRLYGFDLRR